VPMQILNVGINLVPSCGGIYQTVTSFTNAFAAWNYDARVLSFGRPAEDCLEFNVPSRFIQTSRFPVLKQYHFWPGFYTGAVRSLIGVPDVVFIHGLFYHAAGAVAGYCRRRGIPYVVVSHGSLDPFVFTYRRIRKQAWTRIYRNRLLVQASVVLFSTAAEAEKATKWTLGSNVQVVPWPVGFVPEYDKSRAKASLLERYALTSKARLALFCGRVDPIKRPLEMIREFKATASMDWVLLLVGPRSDRLPIQAVEAACRQPGPRCIYVGPAYGESLRDHFRAADLFILMSHKENFSHVTAEALASGVPVFLSRGVDLWRDLEHVGCSFVTPVGQDHDSGTAVAWARVLGMGTEELAAAGRKGRDWARKELSVERFAERVKALCESARKSNH
jgi:glycosyltransferase involved in cell wall biosynthesis